MRWTAALILFAATVQGEVTVVNDAAHQQFVLAYRLLQRDQNADAIEAFETYLGSYPDDTRRDDALYYRALLATRLGNPEKAAECLENVGQTTLVPKHAVALLMGQVYMKTGRPSDALRVLEPVQATTLDASVRAPLHHLRGAAYQQVENLPAAAVQLAAAAQVDGPLQARAAADLGRVRAALGDRPGALKTLALAIALDDGGVTPGAALLAGDLHAQDSAHDHALTAYEIVLLRYQSSPAYDRALVGALWAANDSRQLERVIALHARHAGGLHGADHRIEALLAVAFAQEQLGRHDAALRHLAGAVEDATHLGRLDRVLLRQASSLIALERDDEAHRVMTDLIRQFPETPARVEAELLWAINDETQGKRDDALARLTALVNRGTDSIGYANTLRTRADMRYRGGRYDAAIADMETWLALPNTPCCDMKTITTQVQLVNLYHHVNRHDDAVALADTTLSRYRAANVNIDPEAEQQLLHGKALALVQLGHHDDAVATLSYLIDTHTHTPAAAAARHTRGLVRMAEQTSDDEAAEAIKDLRAASQASSLDPAMRVNGWRMIALHHRRAEEDALAVQALQQLESVAGRLALADDESTYLATQMAATHRAEEALSYLAPILDESQSTAPPVHARRLYLAGQCHAELGRPEQALACFKQVVALSAGLEWKSLLAIGDMLRRLEHYEEAINAYGGLVNVSASRLAVESLLGRAESQRALADHHHRAAEEIDAKIRLQEARRDLLRIIVLHTHASISPLPQLAHVRLHEVSLAMVAVGEANVALSKNLKELIQRYPGTPFETYAQAMQAELQGRHAEALQWLGRIARDDHEDARFRAHVDAARQRIAQRL